MNWPRIITVLLVVAAVMFFWQDPGGAGDAVKGFFHGVNLATQKVGTFLGALFS